MVNWSFFIFFWFLYYWNFDILYVNLYDRGGGVLSSFEVLYKVYWDVMLSVEN